MKQKKILFRVMDKLTFSSSFLKNIILMYKKIKNAENKNYF